ncbi:pectinesterase/pectinesterase inhibitor PPE8B-like [Macadamia integrifolia]|uniref:pectinesterase/pectinesterase inhibitor PPE8B-like n=1 Tax=Macadamia integrifolia TaxID=60698 RepID=UPI001C4F77DB|nr:pectinesterase/pectinesterase inhibitor PPE8B-like [Macadamia integrifolia]
MSPILHIFIFLLASTQLVVARLGKDGLPAWVRTKEWSLLRDQIEADVVVSKDGTGDYRTIMDAVENAPNNSGHKDIIYVKKGLYLENVQISARKSNLMLLGDGMSNTIISGNSSNDGVH